MPQQKLTIVPVYDLQLYPFVMYRNPFVKVHFYERVFFKRRIYY